MRRWCERNISVTSVCDPGLWLMHPHTLEQAAQAKLPTKPLYDVWFNLASFTNVILCITNYVISNNVGQNLGNEYKFQNLLISGMSKMIDWATILCNLPRKQTSLTPVNHNNTSQSRLSISLREQKRAVSAVLCRLHASQRKHVFAFILSGWWLSYDGKSLLCVCGGGGLAHDHIEKERKDGRKKTHHNHKPI